MFGLGFGEIVIIAILALVLLGPDRLPEAAKTIGKTLRDLRKATDGLKGQLESEMFSVEKVVKRAFDTDEAPAAPPVAAAAAARSGAPPPVASAENVPGLDAALIDPLEPPRPPEPPPAAPAADPVRPG